MITSLQFARAYGIEIDQQPVDKWWNDLLRHSECHLHWGNGRPEYTAKMKKGIEWADAEIIRVSELIAQKTKASSGDVVVFNPVGFERNGIVQIDPPACISALKSSDNKLYPVQADPDNPGKFLAFLPKLPSLGYRSYKCANEKAKASGVNAKVSANGALLDNGIIRVDVAADGSINSIVDAVSGETLIKNANVIYLARRMTKYWRDIFQRKKISLTGISIAGQLQLRSRD